MSENIFPIYKPKGPTSHDIINQLRKITGVKKIGHAGTLDPLASGVLIVGIGREATKQLGEIVKKEKEYLAKIKLGIESTTDDEEGEKIKVKVSKIPTLDNIKQAVSEFEGEILQTPPIYSAVKVRGQRGYQIAREITSAHQHINTPTQKNLPQLEPRKVIIKKIKILKYEWPYLELKVITGPGVYIRALARDIGRRLGTGAYIAGLERSRVGEYSKSKAMAITKFERFFKNEKLSIKRQA